MSCANGCHRPCNCPKVNPDGSISTSAATTHTPVPLCWTAAGGEATGVAAATATDITITVANFAQFFPRKLSINAFDEDFATGITPEAATASVRVNSVTALGRNVIGSVAGISGASVSALACNALAFGGSIPAVTASNNIVVNVTHKATGRVLNIAADIEGAAIQ